MPPTVSVIMPLYNQEEYVSQAIEGVLGQTYSDLELVIVDDCSTDRSLDIAREYELKDRRVRVMRHSTKSGAPKSINDGLYSTAGEFVAICASDDLWEPHKLSLQLEILNSGKNLHLVYSDASIMDDKGRMTGQYFSQLYYPTGNRFSGNLFNALLERNFICASTVLLRRSSIVSYPFWNEELRQTADWLYWIEASKKYDFYYIPQLLVRYRVHSRNLSINIPAIGPEVVRFRSILLKKYPTMSRRGRFYGLFQIGHTLCLLGDYKRGRYYLAKSMAVNRFTPNVQTLGALLAFTIPTWDYRIHRTRSRKVFDRFNRILRRHHIA